MDLITDNYIGDDAAKLLSDALKTNTTLTSLDLSGEEENMIENEKKEEMLIDRQAMRLGMKGQKQ